MIKALVISFALVLGACTSTGSFGPATEVSQTQFENVLLKATLLVDQVTVQAHTAYKAKVLKQNDAENVLQAVKSARDGLAIARNLDATAGVNKANVTIATMGAMQIYLATQGTKP